MATLAAGLTDPAAAAETAYLTFAAGIVLLAVGAVAERAAVPVLGTTVVVALVWIVPASPARGFLVEATAALALVFAAVGRMGWIGTGAGSNPGERGVAALLRPVPALGLAFGLQALLRADELLAPPSAAWALVVYAALPALGALAAIALARLDGPVPAALAAAAVLVLGPGFRPATVTALVALAAATALLGDRGTLDRLPAWILPRRLVRALVRLVAAVLLIAPAVWSPSTAFVSALAGAALALRRRPWAAPVCCAVAAGGAWAALLAWGGRPLAQAVLVAVTVPLAVPAVAWPILTWAGRDRVGMAVSALVLAVAAAIMVSVDGALAAPGALAASAVAAGAADREERRGGAQRAVTALQGTWGGLLLAGAALAGAYPWLRPRPLDTVLGNLGVPVDWTGAVAVAALALVVLGAASGAAAIWRTVSVHSAGWRAPRWSAAATGGLVALACLLQVPGTGTELVREAHPVVLSGADGTWSATIDGAASTEEALAPHGGAPGGRAPVRSLVLDSALGNAAGLPPGTPVATLALRWTDRPERTWTLRTGEATGEWAADRSRRQGAAPFVEPTPWRSWIPAEGRFFGHRYRSELRATEPAEGPGGDDENLGPGRADRIEIRLRPDLPPDVALTIFRLELRP